MPFDQLLPNSGNSHISLAGIMPACISYRYPYDHDGKVYDLSHTNYVLAGMMEMHQQQQQHGSRMKRVLEEGDENKVESNDSASEISGSKDAQSNVSTGMINQLERHERSNKNGKEVEKKIKKHRYAFETRSHVDILDDGYRWRKYGQKSVKNNKFPRSYYRCTHQGCNVKKQVQRLSKDEGVVITTYDGIHSHPIQKSMDNFEHILSQMQIYNTPASL